MKRWAGMVTFPPRPASPPPALSLFCALRRSCLALMAALLVLSGRSALGQNGIFSQPQPVGSSSAVHTVPVTFTSNGSVAEIRLVTSGATNADYTSTMTGTCQTGVSYSTNSLCTVDVQFAPQAPGERRGAVLLLDAASNVLAEQPLYGIGVGPLSVFAAATINTIAGNGQWLYTGDGSLATDTSIFLPGGVAVDALGNVYIADSGNNRIRRVDAATHLISTVAGTGTPGSDHPNGPATSAGISNPGALVLDGAGDLYIADSGNHAVRKLVLATGVLTTVAGTLGHSGFNGDGYAATGALLNTPEGLALDKSNNLYIADTKNNRIRRVDASGTITTVAGDGTPAFLGDGGSAVSAELNAPWGIATDPDGNLYIADLNNNRIRKVSGGTITTIMGDGTGTLATDGQPASATPVYNPAAITVDVARNIYVADSGHNIVRKVNALTGIATAVAGTASGAFTGDGGPANAAGIYGPYALTLDAAGNLYIADIFHHRIREVFTAQAALTYPAIRVGRTSAPQQEVIENDGNASLTWSSFAPDTNSTYSTSTTTCALGTPLTVGSTCSFGAEFFPQITGQKVVAHLQLLSDASNSPATITLSGEVDELDPTTTTVSVSSDPLILGAHGALTATVIGSTSTQPVGNVRFYDGSTLLGTSATNSSGVATFDTSGLGLGVHSITANFTGDTTDSPSTSTPPRSVTVKQQPTIALGSNLNPAKVGNSITLTATVTASAVQPTGSVTLADGATVLATSTLTNGAATFNTSNLAAGSHTLTATYAGDSSTVSVTSAAVTEQVAKWSSTTTVSANPAQSTISTDVTYSVTVSPTSSTVPSGTVTLQNNGTAFATLNLGPAGTATYTGNSLPVGSHSITAVFAGDPINDASTSAALPTTVQPAATATTLASSGSPAKAGASLQLTATVSTTPSSLDASLPALTGTVTFKDGTSILGTAPVAANGTAVLATNKLLVGTHPLTAVYSGDTDHATSTSATLSQQIQLATSTVQLSASGSPLIYGRTLTLTAVVGGDGAIPTGSVTFLDGSATLGTATINASGQATLTVSTLSTGSHSLSASYPGDSKDQPSTSNLLTEVITQATTGTVLVSSTNPSVAGTAVTFIATLNSTGSLPTGQILFTEGSTTLGSALLDSSGIARLSISSLAAGTHTIVASFAGDADHAASASSALSQVVNLATSALALSSSANPALINTPVVLTATVTGTGLKPTGSVTFTDGATTLGTQPLNAAGVATLSTSTLTLGAHTLAATYTGDTTHSPSATTTLNERIQQTTTATLASNNNPALVGAPVTLTANVSGATPGITGTVTFLDGAATLGTAPLASNGSATLQTAFAGSGTHRLSASFSGDTSNQGSTSSTLAEVVNLATTSVTLTSSANPSVVGRAVTFTATVTSVGEKPAGSVTLLDGSTTLATVRVTNGIATFSISTLQAGAHSLTATYAGDVGTGTSTSAVLVEVAQQTTSTSLGTSAASILTNEAITLTATVAGSTNSTALVTFLDGATVLGTAAVNAAGQAAFSVPALSAGSHALSARYAGDQFHLPSTSAPVTETVALRPSTTSLTASSSNYLTGEQLTLVAVVHTTGPVGPTGTVTFTSGGFTLGTAPVSAAGAATLIFSPTAPSYKIVASYAGDASYSGSTSGPYTLTAGSTSTFTLTANPSELTMASGAHQAMSLMLNSPSSFSDTLSFGCIDLPANATCTFPKPEVALAAHGTATVDIVVDTGNPLGSGRATGSSASLRTGTVGSVLSASLLAPLAALFGLLLWRARLRISLPGLLLLLLCAGASLGLTGCGTPLSSAKTPPGSYQVRIVAAGTGTGVSQFATITVTVK